MNYGFITFDKPENAYRAFELSAKDLKLNNYDIGFGGRREFCKQNYADLGEFFFSSLKIFKVL